MLPKIEFSTGTMPAVAVPAATAQNTSSNEVQERVLVRVPKNLSAASSLKAPGSP